MGRPGLSHHPKFLMLARSLGEIAARGALELMWEVAYESGDERLGSPDAVEAAARWRGDRGVLFAALRDATGQGDVGFIEERDGVWCVHDLWDHAPDYVRKRATREEQRRVKGRSIAAERRTVTGQNPFFDQAVGPPPAPTRAPAPAPAPAPDQDLSAPDRADAASEGGRQGTLIPLPPKPPRERRLSLAQAAKAYFDAERAKKTDLSDESFTPVEVNSMLKGPLEEHGRVVFKQMMNAFLADSRQAEKAWPFRLFVAIHRSYRTNAVTGQNSNHFTDVTNVDPKEWNQ